MSNREVNLIGGFYKDSSLPWSAQDTVNWLPVPAQEGGTRSPMKLRGAPGLRAMSQTVIPLPQFATWDPEDRIGEFAALTNSNRTFFSSRPTNPPDTDPGEIVRVRATSPKVSGRFYIEVYSNAAAGIDDPGLGTGFRNIQRSLRFGIAPKNVVASALASNSGFDASAAWEIAPKFIDNIGTRLRQYGVRGGGITSPTHFPAVNNPSTWAGFAVELSGPPSAVVARCWSIIDGAWGGGITPSMSPTSPTEILIGGQDTTVQGGFVPYASIRYPLSLNPGQEITLNAGQQPFQIGAAAFEPGGVLAGFTPGWPS
jgi:hypothetical protein